MLSAERCLPLAFPLDNELGDPEQNALDFGIGKSADGFAGLVGELDRARVSGVNRAMAIEDGDDVRWSNSVEAAIAQHRVNRYLLGWSAMLKRVQNGHRGFDFAQIAGDR